METIRPETDDVDLGIKKRYVWHFRHKNKEGKVSTHGGITVVYEPEPDAFGVTVCSTLDQFDRKEGIKRAGVRARNHAKINPASHKLLLSQTCAGQGRRRKDLSNQARGLARMADYVWVSSRPENSLEPPRKPIFN